MRTVWKGVSTRRVPGHKGAEPRAAAVLVRYPPSEKEEVGIARESMVRDTSARDGAVPLYHRIFLSLRDEIASGRHPAGATLPSEHELAAIHGVSRITARRALNELAGAGLVSRRPRIGTVVLAQPRAEAIAADLDQAVETLISFGRETQVRVVSIAEIPAETGIAGLLAVEKGSPIIEAVRMRDRDGAPLGRVTSHAIPELAPLFTPQSLLANPLLSLLGQHGHRIGGGRETISARPADEEMVRLLGLEWRAPLLTVERLVTDISGRPLLHTIAEYRADHYRIELNLNSSAR